MVVDEPEHLRVGVGQVDAQIAAAHRHPGADVDNAVFSAITGALAREETVTIAGFGTFATKRRPARQGHNPRTGESIAIAASKAPSFKAGKSLRDAVR